MAWLHADCSTPTRQVERLSQVLQRGRKPVYEVALEPAPDRVLQRLEGGQMRPLARCGKLADDLGALTLPGWQWEYQRLSERPARVPETSRHLARLWAAQGGSTPSQSRKLALTYQLVTHQTGAVVLENQQQYENAGLKAADPASLPSVPEPGLLALLTVAGMGLARSRRARR